MFCWTIKIAIVYSFILLFFKTKFTVLNDSIFWDLFNFVTSFFDNNFYIFWLQSEICSVTKYLIFLSSIKINSVKKNNIFVFTSAALSTLNDELNPVQRNEVDVSVENKKDIALSLFYKVF